MRGGRVAYLISHLYPCITPPPLLFFEAGFCTKARSSIMTPWLRGTSSTPPHYLAHVWQDGCLCCQENGRELWTADWQRGESRSRRKCKLLLLTHLTQHLQLPHLPCLPACADLWKEVVVVVVVVGGQFWHHVALFWQVFATAAHCPLTLKAKTQSAMKWWDMISRTSDNLGKVTKKADKRDKHQYVEKLLKLCILQESHDEFDSKVFTLLTSRQGGGQIYIYVMIVIKM